MTHYPTYVCPIVRGIYCETNDIGPPRNEYGDPFTNRTVADILGKLPPMIGMLSIGNPRAEDCADVTLQGLVDLEEPKFMFWAYDVRTRQPMDLANRLMLLKSYAAASGKCVGMVFHKLVTDEKERDKFLGDQLLQGFPGIYTREPGEISCTLPLKLDA